MQQRAVAGGQTHHGVIDRRITVGIQAHGLAHNIGAFGPAAVEQAHFIHGIQKLAVRRFEAVDLRDRAGHNHTHGIGHIIRFQRFGDWLFHHCRMQPQHIGVHHFGFFL